MDLLGADTEKVYRYSDLKTMLTEAFEPALHEDYSILPQSVSAIGEAAASLDRKGLLARLIHMKAWPQHSLFLEKTVLTVYPFAQAEAEFVYEMIGRGGE